MSVERKLSELFSLEGKVIALTGATGGIGAALAQGLADAGGDMLLCDIAGAPFRLDLSDMQSIRDCVENMIAAKGRIDVLVNCAGINKRTGFLDFTESDYDKIMDINLKGLYFLSQEVAKHMIRKKSGNIINISSHNAVGMLGGCSVYGASKAAVSALTRSMAIEWAKHGIRANALAPGHILTPLTEVTWDNPERADYLRERIAMRRPGTPEELVGVTVMLASDASSYMSGMMLHVDGGCLAGGSPWAYDTEY